jgi:putative protein-disulfide isomerase
MPDSSSISLYYVHDPMCSWCWGFGPAWTQLKQQLPPQLELVQWVGGLATDCNEPMAESMQHSLQDTWRHIQQRIPGTRFNFDFWTQNSPRRSTYPACRAVICAREMADKGEQMTLAIQQAYYLQARNPSDLDTLSDLADSIKLDRTEFDHKIRSTQVNQLLIDELAQVRAIGVNSFPSLVIEQGTSRMSIPIDYNSAPNMLHYIKHFLAHDTD